MCKTLTSCSKPAERLTCAVEMRPQIHAANTHGVSHSSSHHSRHHYAVLRAHAPRESHVQCDFGGILSTYLWHRMWGTRVQDIRPVKRRQRKRRKRWGETVDSRSTHIWRESLVRCHTRAMSHHALLHANAPSTGRVRCMDLQGDFGGILTSFHTVWF